MVPEYSSVIARMAYVWGWPLVNMHNRREMFRKLPSIDYIGGALEPWFDKTWRPGEIERVK
jgi:hypothetical protein